MIAVESEIVLGDVRKRFDIVVFKNALPWLLVECKEMNVKLNDAVLQQILNYNIRLQVQYLVITNGMATYAVHLTNGTFSWQQSLPNF